MLSPADDGTGYGFRHALLQEAVYDDLLPGERRRYHLGFVGALEAGIESQAADGRRARHDWPKLCTMRWPPTTLPTALRASVAAGTAAMAAGAFVDASKHLERAVQLSTSVPDAGSDRGRRAARSSCGSRPRPPASRRTRPAPCGCGRRRSTPPAPRRSPEDRARLLLGLAICANDVFDNELAVQSTRAANELLADEPPRFLRAQARADLSRDLFVIGDDDEAIRAAEDAIAMASEVGDLRNEALARGRLALSRLYVGDIELAKADAQRATEIARTTRDRFVVFSVYVERRDLVRHAGRPGDRGRDPRGRGHPPVGRARHADGGARGARRAGICGRRASGTRASGCSTRQRATKGSAAGAVWPSRSRRLCTTPSACQVSGRASLTRPRLTITSPGSSRPSALCGMASRRMRRTLAMRGLRRGGIRSRAAGSQQPGLAAAPDRSRRGGPRNGARSRP